MEQTHVEKARAVIRAVSTGDLDQLDSQLADDVVCMSEVSTR